ncbi:hypothetical protein Tco_0331686, partial [Tanacetum coccineum]
KVAKQRVTQGFSPETVISFPPLGDEDGTEGPMIIEAKIGGHFMHRIYVDVGASSEIHARNKKPDGPGYHTPHRIQWRNHLATRTDIFASKNR